MVVPGIAVFISKENFVLRKTVVDNSTSGKFLVTGRSFLSYSLYGPLQNSITFQRQPTFALVCHRIISNRLIGGDMVF